MISTGRGVECVDGHTSHDMVDEWARGVEVRWLRKPMCGIGHAFGVGVEIADFIGFDDVIEMVDLDVTSMYFIAIVDDIIAVDVACRPT